jgi:catechol 2,3-dioxygenase-like lactoylglutathione lyase family enzyme
MFRHVGIVVTNLDEMLAFYQNFLNLEILYNETETGEFLNHLLNSDKKSANILKLGKEGNTIVELLFFDEKNISEKNLFQNGLTHFALTVPNVDVLYENFLEKKYQVLNTPKVSDNGKFKVFFGKDPENNFIEFVEIL